MTFKQLFLLADLLFCASTISADLGEMGEMTVRSVRKSAGLHARGRKREILNTLLNYCL